MCSKGQVLYMICNHNHRYKDNVNCNTKKRTVLKYMYDFIIQYILIHVENTLMFYNIYIK